ncbi:type II toxin-antitoxin system VapC family toxin [Dolichospermum sp. UHCC 0259]|jgi:PIN domain nuclease of toxin-antitoxin system|uniref:type II toxin-antitoxin system VapC family toxin n=1 Tax=Dolichospermum sp. UHCC 0259 TaxID=2590010 RepID=UPI0014466E1F|nr:type II toxin-antitoxin system VapC family toxin [Dolichospermum sp. UHCC 0259]MTJ47271.1 type II toxin-antitoxin system VapC family toxin [Dolichospermum sp. UHCC 0259]
MKFLLDTHAFLWWVTNAEELSNTVRKIITDPDNTILFSVVSAWEIVIKFRTGKLSLPEEPEIYIPSRLAANQFQALPIEINHVLQVANIQDYHKDPFDRILIAQSQIEKVPILTKDNLIIQYQVMTIW